jgi:hypothetical protein
MATLFATSKTIGKRDRLVWMASLVNDSGQRDLTVEGAENEALWRVLERTLLLVAVNAALFGHMPIKLTGAEYYDPDGVPIPAPHISQLLAPVPTRLCD